jgi:guanine deaminase
MTQNQDPASEAFMREAIGLAETGVRRGDGGPFGAVVVREGVIVGRGWNRVVADVDPTAHAEVNAIRDACRNLGTFQLDGCRLYTSCQPCPMCLAAAYWARIEQIWYAATGRDAAAIGFDDHHIACQMAEPEERRLIGHGQLLRDEALAVFRLWRDSELRVDY